MPTLITCLSSGKGTWSEVIKIIQAQPWDKVFLITDDFGKNKFPLKQENIEFMLIDSSFHSEISQIVGQLKTQLYGKIADFEVAINFVSGNGKEHMALLEAVLELGLNFRLVTVKDGKLEVMGMQM